MKISARGIFLSTYPFYFLLVIVGLLRLDVPSRVDPLLPRPWEAPYKLPNVFLKAETNPDFLRQKLPYEVSDIITNDQVPALKGVDPKVFFRDPSFRPETTAFRPDERYEKEWGFSVRRGIARIFLFGDSFVVSYDYKPLSYYLIEEYGIPTWRRTYGEIGGMETVYAFLAETPESELRNRYVVFDISEGWGIWPNPQYNGMPTGTFFHYLYRKAAYQALKKWGIGKDSGEQPAAPLPPLLPTVRKLSTYTTPGGNVLREDPSHINPVLFEYLGTPRAMGFWWRNLAYMTWYGPHMLGGTHALSLGNWIARIGNLARKKGAFPVVLFVPSKLSTYWPILGPILDYGKLYAYVSKVDQGNKAIRSPEALRAVLPLGIRSWRDFVTDTCRREGVGLIDLTEPFREAALRGDVVYRDFDTHWNDEGVRIAADRISRFVSEGTGH